MIRPLKTFLAVARYGTFAAAGQQVGLTQSAVSAQIRALEADLGQTLFDRTGRSAVLNAAGRRVQQLAEQIIILYEQMAAPEDEAQWQGQLRIGAIASAQPHLLPPALKQLRASLPRVRVKVVPGVSLQLLAQVDAGEVDLAVLIRPPFELPADLDWHPLVREPFVLIAPLDTRGNDPLALLQACPFVRYDQVSFGGRQVETFLRRQRLQVNEAIELDSLQAIVSMVEAGMGVALLPQAKGLALDRRQVRMLPLGEYGFDREIGYIVRRSASRQPMIARLAACLDATAAAARPD